MKLLTKTTLYYITISLFIFFILGIAIYQMVKRLEDSKVNQELTDQRIRFTHDLVHRQADLLNTTIISGGLIQLNRVTHISKPEIQFKDTLIYDPIHSNYVPYRRLTYYLDIDGILFRMSIFKSLYESNYLIEQVALVITSVTLLFLLTVYFLYRYSFAQVWSEFFITIDKIRHFNLSSPEKLDFPQSMIIEFNQLNEVLEKMIDRITKDFNGLKEFTGNLTHEIQTPLAVIRSKADLLLQDKESNENQMQLAGEINAETVKLSKLVKALNLFTKLDHSLFQEKATINVESVIRSKLTIFEDFIEARNITVNFTNLASFEVEMNPELADILFVNLVKNSIRHNIDKGKIEISINKDLFTICNTGEKIDFNPEVLFDRFTKLSETSESLGIGLSIVKKICDYYQFQIRYNYMNGLHEITVKF